MPALSLDALAVAVDEGGGSPPYVPAGELLAAGERHRFAAYIAEHRDVHAAGVALLDAGRPGVAELAGRALRALPAPDGPQTLVLVQSGHDHDHVAMPLPRILHECPWPVDDELAISHGEDRAGLEVLDLLGWALRPGHAAVVVLADRPEYGDAGTPPTGAVVALRLVPGEGPLTLVDRGRGPCPDADRVVRGRGPSQVWERLHVELAARAPAAGERILLRLEGQDGDDGLPWLLLRAGTSAPWLRRAGEGPC